jgi:hypothetical protein
MLLEINENEKQNILNGLSLLREQTRAQAYETLNIAGVNTRYIEKKKMELYRIDNLMDAIETVNI